MKKGLQKMAKDAKTFKALMKMDSKAIIDAILASPILVDLYVKLEVFKAKDDQAIYVKLIDFGVPDVSTKDGKKEITLTKGALTEVKNQK